MTKCSRKGNLKLAAPAPHAAGTICADQVRISHDIASLSARQREGQLEQAEARQRQRQREREQTISCTSWLALLLKLQASACNVWALLGVVGVWYSPGIPNTMLHIKSAKKHSHNHVLLLQFMKDFKSIEDKYNYIICIPLQRVYKCWPEVCNKH